MQATIIAAAELHGWLVHHGRPARTNAGWRTAVSGNVGFPDLVLARNGVVLFLELKSERGRLTPDQTGWLEHLPRSHLVRPSTLDTVLEWLR